MLTDEIEGNDDDDDDDDDETHCFLNMIYQVTTNTHLFVCIYLVVVRVVFPLMPCTCLSSSLSSDQQQLNTGGA